MDSNIQQAYTALLHGELVSALGCTEPIAIAYAAAQAQQSLGEPALCMELATSGNVVKNAKGVVVPNSGGLKGVKIAAILGAVGGCAQAQLEVLEHLEPAHIEKAKQLESENFCSFTLIPDVPNLYIRVTLRSEHHHVVVVISQYHANIVLLQKDGQDILQSTLGAPETTQEEKALLNIQDIIEYAKTVPLEDIASPIERQIVQNSKLSQEGLTHDYGANIGKTLLQLHDNSPHAQICASAAAGSDARMNGCALPAVVNSGSGNQGLTASVPVIEFAKQTQASHEALCRALVLSNLIALHQKRLIGSLSAFCGAVCAACGAGAGIMMLDGGDYEDICNVIINTLANVGGILCDGAKSSCAAKIASAVEATLLAVAMAKKGVRFPAEEGIVKADIEQTVANIGQIARVGMRETDLEILRIMTQ